MATLKVGRASDNEPKPTQKAKETFYADAEGNVTTDAEKSVLHLTDKGQPILPHIAAKYGFVDGDIKGKAKAEPVKESVEVKKQEPTENKAVGPKSKK